MKKKQLLIVCAIAALFYGCSSNCKDRGECECVTKYDCEENQICRSGACIDYSTEAWIVPIRDLGETCISHQECMSGFCLPLGPDNGGVCTRSCSLSEECGEGWTCRDWTSTDVFEISTRVCVQETSERLCYPCTVDGQCNAEGDLCVALEEGSVCARDCSEQPCPTGYTCEQVMRGERTFSQCLPIDNTCECGPGKEGMGRACTNSNEFGVCAGWSYCAKKDGEYAWSDCDAQMPAEEICNGLDDDCDGLVDSFDPGISHADLSEQGALYPICYLGGCIGHWQCRETAENSFGWVCDAGDPENEVCNGVDDNCNGEIDETFKDANGLFADLNNCGSCGVSCLDTIQRLRRDGNGNVLPDAAKCVVKDDKAVCMPLQCEDGYYPYPHEAPVSCLKLESPACQVCGSDSDCHVYSDRCLELKGDFGTHCLQSCSEDSPYSGCTGQTGVQSCCPDGYQCQARDGGKFCVPRGESCSCDTNRLNMVRNCVVTSGTDICQGRQTCQIFEGNGYAWSECSTDEVTLEVCDGQDNNCDGEIDEDFRDEKGRYNAPEHCGACNEDCTSRWNAPVLHADGACLLSGDNYTCQFTGCKLENDNLGRRCSQDDDCPNGMKCNRQVYYCDVQDGEVPDVKCSSDNDCKSISSSHACVGGVCRVTIQYYDVNGIAADGCECGVAVKNGTDEPDTFDAWPKESDVYIDRNCDGIDGDAATSLFVSAQTDKSLGTMDHPYRTIKEAMAAFDESKHSAILVAAGTYIEQVVMKSGAKIYGGYSADFRTRNIILNPTQITAPPPATDEKPGSVYFPNVNKKTVISGFVIQGYDVSESEYSSEFGRNAYAVYVAMANANVVITNNSIIGGRGGDGQRGSLGSSGADGADGGEGRDSRECGDAFCEGQKSDGGVGGKNAACSSANGRVGAYAQGGQVTQLFTYGSNSRDGIGGENNSYRHSYPDQEEYCKYDCMSGGYSNGQNGGNGDNGSNGKGGEGCTISVGVVVNHVWHGFAGSNGTPGAAAMGGGGGGAGGSSINTITYCSIGTPVGDIGGSGGGGGAGGCGGKPGSGGKPGGGSFGIWIAETASSPQIAANVIRLGYGGKGGDGGNGGAGGKGGKGGKGGANESPAWCAGAGGAGGGGGDGGSAGGAGGGCGGISVGIAGIGISSNLDSKNTFEYPENNAEVVAGAPGLGGNSPAGSESFGKDGLPGAVASVLIFTEN
ncbi:MAG: hypothetical protein IJU23_05730 [Proteobacteria bacterium]|nr:hypothetical protein [Pseudomonadota bacterium]